MQLLAIELDVNEKLCIRNPQRTDLGRKILKNSILLLDEIGFERFTFKKLAQQMDSTEASIYRYFESKHLLLLYLLNWYWEWIKFRISLRLMNIREPQEKLRAVISTIVDTAKRNAKVDFIDEDILHSIVVVEGTKAYHNKEVDEQNKEGFFLSYKSLCQKIADILLEINPLFPYPRAMASNLLEMANNHIYFAQHLPRLTDIKNDSNVMQKVEDLLLFFAFKLINPTGEESAVLKKDEKKKRMLIQDIS
ncbi:MAG: TetR family transcriptional regulator [Saprospiraceae bacterium]|nr:TetR family transcriptional regulator [Saprospiraceae bacterium]